ncbi:MAG: Kae1-like domain-containing protein, partial [Gaiellaceae bacterium]
GSAESVVLSDGTFQNRVLAASTRRSLERLGFRVLEHERVPANDGGIAYGQAVVAACA